MMNSAFDKTKLRKLNIDELIRPEAFSDFIAAPSTGFPPVALSSPEGGVSPASTSSKIENGGIAGNQAEEILAATSSKGSSKTEGAIAGNPLESDTRERGLYAIADERGVSEQGQAPEVATTGTPESVLSADLADELREERAAIMEHDGGLSKDEAEARAVLAYPCCCFGRRFWVSKYGAIRCAECHPPAVAAYAVRWFEIPETGGAE